jgi:hypothetical protein
MAKEKTSASVEVRLLVDSPLGKINDVVSVAGHELQSLKEHGYVDDHPDAVAYAKSLKEQKQ